MAGILNVSQAAVNRYEHGFSEAPFAVVVSLADYYDVSLDYLFGRTENPQGKKFNMRVRIVGICNFICSKS